MLDNTITAFLEKAKQEWLRKEIKPKTKEDKIEQLKQEAELYFTTSWLKEIITSLSNSKDIDRLQYTTHAPKFSHPDVRLDAINFKTKRKENGLIATGNARCVNLDMYSNSGAAYLKKEYIYVYEFLICKLPDNNMIIEHLLKSTLDIKVIFAQLDIDASFEKVRINLLKCVSSGQPPLSDEKIKQVYFPVDNDYHLLSILTPSPLMSELKSRINNINYSNQNKNTWIALKNKTPIQAELNEIYNLTKIGYGGANKQNISVLNNKDGGYFYLLSSLPPQLEKRPVQAPKKDFFKSCLWPGLFKIDFEEFHKVLSWRKNNIDVRDKRDDIVLNSITKIMRLVDQIREIKAGWSERETYDGLNFWQKIWLDEKYAAIRTDEQQNQDYLNQAQSYFANWFIGNYKQTTKDNKLLGDDDIEHIKSILKQEQELLA